jgi:hypothetical protein
LLTHKLCLDFNHIFQSFRLTKFLYVSDSGRNICVA